MVGLKLYLPNIRPYFVLLMKRQRLQVDYEIDFEVFGIVSAFKDYKLAWNLNDRLHINLSRQSDLRLQFVDFELIVSNYLYQTENTQVSLIKNRSHEMDGKEGAYFIPELIKMDYFLRIMDPEMGEKWMSALRAIPGVEYVNRIDLDRLKSKENFIF
jgi:hypothetical protein